MALFKKERKKKMERKRLKKNTGKKIFSIPLWALSVDAK